MKTKPTQHSVKELREIGIQPDIVLCRVDRPLPDGERRKIALFTNVPPEAVIPAARRRLASTRSRRRCTPKGSTRSSAASSSSTVRPADLSIWHRIVDALEHPEHAVHIAMVGKYVDLTESYKSLSEALIHAGIHTRSKVKIHYVDSEAIERDGVDCARRHGRDPRSRRLRQARRRGQDRRDPLRARERRALLRHLPRHAARGHRVRAQHGAGSPTPTAPSSIRRRRIRSSR